MIPFGENSPYFACICMDERFSMELALRFTTVILRTVEAMHPHPAPGSAIFAALNPEGCSLELFTHITDTLVKHGLLSRNGADYRMATSGEERSLTE
jgi:hypothetical protein